ncbi:MAG: phosphotransferase [Candidatus Latescibacteria bacterium]|nr:phosphotransferase [Candidatus Latescibacterota bacterium]
MLRVPDEPLPTADQIRARLKGKPSFSAESIDPLLRKHGFGSVRSCENRSSYVPNVVLQVECEDLRQLAIKIQVFHTWDWTLSQEALALAALSQSTDVLLPRFWILDQDRDVLDYPVLIEEWLPGPSAADHFSAADLARRAELARQLGLTHAKIHGCPCQGLNLPKLDLRNWRQLILDLLFGHSALRDDLRDAFPEVESNVRSQLDQVQSFAVADEPGLIWRDGLLHNAVVAEADNGCRLGVFDFQSAAISQPYADHFKVRGSLGGGTPEWDAFVDGYKSVAQRAPTEPDSPIGRAFRMYAPAYQIRHFYELFGYLHYRTPKWLNGLFEALETGGAPA